MNIQDEMQKIHHKFGVSEMANYKIEQFIENLIKEDRAQQLTLTDVGNCPFEAYAVFCIECDRQGMKPIKYKDYLNLK
tara:strand:+ start:454 stop:687 length:234 start_codon:yes stop_codon:yes gene_type:complete